MNLLPKKTFFLFICIILTAFNVTAQRKVVDSLLTKLTSLKDDTARFYTCGDLVEAYKNVDLDSGVYYAQQQILISRRVNDLHMSAIALNQYGYALFFASNYPDALSMLYKALQLGEQAKDTLQIAISNLQLGFVYRNSDEYAKAIEFFKKYKVAADYYSDEHMQITFYTDAGRAYEQMDVLDSALLYDQKAYKLASDFETKLKTPNVLQGILCNLATVQSKLARNEIAINLFHQSISQGTENQDYRTLARSENELAKHFYKNKQVDSAIFYSKQALEIDTQHSFLVQTLDAGALVTNIFKNGGKYDSAFKYQQITLAAKDSLFSREKINRMQNQEFNYRLYQQEITTEQEHLRNKQKMYFLLSFLLVFVILVAILWRSNRNKQKSRLQIEKAYTELKSAQAQLIQKEKMASLGELTAGIAHEIQNPLNFVNNFSDVNKELLAELNEEINKGNLNDAKSIAKDAIANEEKINHHGKRADAIVKGMLQHSRASTGKKELTDINKLADEYLRLSYHGLRAKDKSFNVGFTAEYDENIGEVSVVLQDIGRVLLNLFNNAFYAVKEKAKTAGGDFKPEVSVQTRKLGDKIEIAIRDNGNGIPQSVIDKIFQPFFTTKPTGEGTGLGLSLSYDIITKEHSGSIKVNSKETKGAEFIIQLPIT